MHERFTGSSDSSFRFPRVDRQVGSERLSGLVGRFLLQSDLGSDTLVLTMQSGNNIPTMSVSAAQAVAAALRCETWVSAADPYGFGSALARRCAR